MPLQVLSWVWLNVKTQVNVGKLKSLVIIISFLLFPIQEDHPTNASLFANWLASHSLV